MHMGIPAAPRFRISRTTTEGDVLPSAREWAATLHEPSVGSVLALLAIRTDEKEITLDGETHPAHIDLK